MEIYKELINLGWNISLSPISSLGQCPKGDGTTNFLDHWPCFFRKKEILRNQIREVLNEADKFMKDPGTDPAAGEKALCELRALAVQFRNAERSSLSWQDVHGGDDALMRRAEELIQRLEWSLRKRFIPPPSASTGPER
jgi:hypothetical protein